MAKSSISKDSFFNVSGNPNLDAADTGVDPSTGRILTKKERIAIFKKRKINANKVFGKTDPKLSKVGKITKPLAKFGAIVKSDDGVKGSSSDKEDKGGSSGVQPQNKLIEGLSKQISNNSRKITILKNIVKSNIEKVSKILKGDAEKEKKEQREDQRQTQLEDEKDKKKKKEGLLEGVGKSVGKSLLKPVEAVGKTVKGILGRLTDAFTALFMGFVANKGIKMFQALLSGDTETFKKMRNQIIGSLAIAGGIFLALNGGLLALPGIISTVAGAIIPVMTAIIGFLASPAGLIALGLAAGIATIFAIKKIIHKSRGGDVFANERKEIDEEFKEAGLRDTSGFMNFIKGERGEGKRYLVKRDGKDTRLKFDELTEEEKAAVVKRDAAKTNLKDLNKQRQREIKESNKKIDRERKPGYKQLYDSLKKPGHPLAESPSPKDYPELRDYIAETNRLKKAAELKIQQKYDKKAVTISGDDAINTTINTNGNDSVINSNVTKKGVTTLNDVEAEVKEVNNGGTGGEIPTNEGVGTDSIKVDSKNGDNKEVEYTEMQYNAGG